MTFSVLLDPSLERTTCHTETKLVLPRFECLSASCIHQHSMIEWGLEDLGPCVCALLGSQEGKFILERIHALFIQKPQSTMPKILLLPTVFSLYRCSVWNVSVPFLQLQEAAARNQPEKLRVGEFIRRTASRQPVKQLVVFGVKLEVSSCNFSTFSYYTEKRALL